MKRFLIVLLCFICLIFCFPTTAYAWGYSLKDTELTVFVDDEHWYVFTRDNLYNNSELDDLGFTAEQVNQFFEGNNAYLDAMRVYEDGHWDEFIILINDTDLVNNLSSCDEAEIDAIAQNILNDLELSKYNIYPTEKYQFIQFDYFDTAYDHYVYEFVTIFNNRLYSFIFKSPQQFSSSIYTEFAIIINSVQFTTISNDIPESTAPSEPDSESVTTESNPTVDVSTSENQNSKNISNLGITLICILIVIGTGAIVGVLCCTEDKQTSKKKK